MNSFHVLGTVVAALTLLGGPTSAVAALRPEIKGIRVPLGCMMVDQKMIVITNTSGATISAGTAITYDAERTSDGIHYGKTFTSDELPAGASVQRPGSPSTSCAAWFIRPMVLAPKQ